MNRFKKIFDKCLKILNENEYLEDKSVDKNTILLAQDCLDLYNFLFKHKKQINALQNELNLYFNENEFLSENIDNAIDYITDEISCGNDSEELRKILEILTNDDFYVEEEGI